MQTSEGIQLSEWISLVPHLKLSPSKVLPVIDVMAAEDTDRRTVSEALVKLFPGKSEKSVVRGMALPAMTRLHFVRTSEDTIRLAPNGIGVLEAGLPPAEFVGLSIRSLATQRLAIPLSFVENPVLMGREVAHLDKQTRERVGRFASYLEWFPAHRGVWKSRGFDVLPDASYRALADVRAIRGLFRTALPVESFLELDEARMALVRESWSRKWLVTSFDVDEWLLRDAASKRPVVYLWKQATRSLSELFHQGRSYGGLTVRSG